MRQPNNQGKTGALLLSAAPPQTVCMSGSAPRPSQRAGVSRPPEGPPVLSRQGTSRRYRRPLSARGWLFSPRSSSTSGSAARSRGVLLKVPASTSWMSACDSVSCSSSTLARRCRCSSFSVCKPAAHACQRGALCLHTRPFLLTLGFCLCLRPMLQQHSGHKAQALASFQPVTGCRPTLRSLRLPLTRHARRCSAFLAGTAQMRATMASSAIGWPHIPLAADRAPCSACQCGAFPSDLAAMGQLTSRAVTRP